MKAKTKTTQRMASVAATVLLGYYGGAAERLTIEPARLLPDYAKSMLLTYTNAGANRVPWGGNFAATDLNKDGRLDIVQTEGPLPRQLPGDMSLGIFLQNGGGGLAKQPIVPIRTTCTLDILANDFNGDGNVDLLANDTGNDLVLALGNGNGTFQEPHFLGLAVSYYPAVADLDGDSNLDLVGASASGAVLVFSGLGDGSFVYRTDLAAAIAPRGGCGRAAGAIMIADANGDNTADIMVASPPDNGNYLGNLHVFFGNGDGTFSGPVTTSGVAGFRGATGDFNGDGFADYVGDRYNPAQLDIWLGLGDGSFTRSDGYSLSGIEPVVVTVADLNDDGISDVTVSGQAPDGVPLSIFLGKGDGTFRPRQTFVAANGGLALNIAPAVVDFNRDALPDLLMHAYTTNDAGITIALNRGEKPRPGGGFKVTAQAQINPVVLEATTDLITWTPLATNAAPRGTWPVVDAVQTASRFYRTRQQ